MPQIDQGKYLYSFAVVADTHLNQNDVECNSPFDVNRRANNRLRYVIEDLNGRDLALVIHLGDIVHPVPSMGELYVDSAKRFFEQFENLRHPFYLIPGNHDVGDKPIDWGPAGTVRDDFLEAWTEIFGAHYFHHEHQGIHFIGLNTQLPGSGLAMEAEQAQWLQSTLDGLRGQRIFVSSHYPPYLLHANESEHYDNLGPEGRDWLLSSLSEYRVEGLFCGHVHQYWFHRYEHTQCHLLPSTAFTRQDYSEMFRVDSGDEFGRNDEQKLGYMLIHLFEDGHGVEMVRTDGREIEANQKPYEFFSIDKSPAFCNFWSQLGFDMRQDWFETVQIPPSGGLDEFDRKAVRNDYGLLALLDMGIRKLRLPLADLVDPVRRSRLCELQSFGFHYCFYSFGAPDGGIRDLIAKQSELIESWVLCCRIDELAELDSEFFQLAQDCNVELVFSPLRSKQDLVETGKKYYHVINHGFTINDLALLDKWNATPQAVYFDRYLLRLGFDESVPGAFGFAQQCFQTIAKPASIHLRLSENNPAANLDDDNWLCRRLTEALLLGHASPACEFYCDTFADNDRGYFPRAGVVDRRYNPRARMLLIQQINSLLSEREEFDEALLETGDHLVSFTPDTAGKHCIICIPDDDFGLPELEAYLGRLAGQVSDWRMLDLVSNETISLDSKSDLNRTLAKHYPFALLG